MQEPNCMICNDEGWVCEGHPLVAWEGGNAECCGAPGMPCRCNTSNPPWVHFKKIIASVDED